MDFGLSSECSPIITTPLVRRVWTLQNVCTALLKWRPWCTRGSCMVLGSNQCHSNISMVETNGLFLGPNSKAFECTCLCLDSCWSPADMILGVKCKEQKLKWFSGRSVGSCCPILQCTFMPSGRPQEILRMLGGVAQVVYLCEFHSCMMEFHTKREIHGKNFHHCSVGFSKVPPSESTSSLRSRRHMENPTCKSTGPGWSGRVQWETFFLCNLIPKQGKST